MDPSRQWQQPDPSGGYGQTPPGGYPPRPPQPPYGQPQQPQQPQYPPPQYPQPQPQYPQQPQYPPQQPQPQQPQYPPQPPAGQPYSAVPYATPYSAPPAYQQAPPSAPPALLGPPEAPPSRRNRWFAALIVSSVLLVVLVVAIVVVALNRGNDTPSTPQAGTSQGPVDKCLVGKWKQTTYQHNVDLTDTEVGKRENLGKIKFTGGGKIWEIRDDGSAVEDDTATVYNGKADDGRAIKASWEGRTEWKLSTKDGVLSFAGGEATTVVTINVDGSAKGRIELEPNLDPTPYTCNGDIWRTSGKDSANDFARFDRQK